MGGYIGITSRRDCRADIFFGVDYHSHLGTKLGGLALYDQEIGLQREIHNIEGTPFRTRFGDVFEKMKGTSAIGCISDSEPQPLLIRSKLGRFAICMTGIINNAEELIETYLQDCSGSFDAMTGGRVNATELTACLISRKDSFAEGIRFAQEVIDGTAAILILKNDGHLIVARDKVGRLPMHIGRDADGYVASFEAFAYQKLGYETVAELGPGEIAELSPEGMTRLAEPGKKKKVCAFLWSYYGYPTSEYEGRNVETMRYRNGAIMAEHDMEAGNFPEIDYVGGVPDSGTPHAIGYANRCGVPFARAFIKYTPTWSRSFMPASQTDRNRIAKMKQIPVKELIEGKSLLFVDDSIVRGTQLRETVEFLYESGAKAVHMRSACPPILYGCKYLNFSRSTGDMDLLARKVIFELEGEEGFDHLDEYRDSSAPRGKKLRQCIAEKMGFASLEFQSVEGIVKALDMDPDELCTYCWNGKE